MNNHLLAYSLPLVIPSEDYLMPERGFVELIVRKPDQTLVTFRAFEVVSSRSRKRVLAPGKSIEGFVHIFSTESGTTRHVLTDIEGNYAIKLCVRTSYGTIESEWTAFTVRGAIPAFWTVLQFPPLDINVLGYSSGRSWTDTYVRYVTRYPRSPLSFYLRLLLAEDEMPEIRRREMAEIRDDQSAPMGARVLANRRKRVPSAYFWRNE